MARKYVMVKERKYHNRRGNDPTPEELAAACAAIPGRTHKRNGERMPEQHMHAPFYAWLFDPEAVAPLAVAVPEQSDATA